MRTDHNPSRPLLHVLLLAASSLPGLFENGAHCEVLQSCIQQSRIYSYCHQLGQSPLFWPGQYFKRTAWFADASRLHHQAMGKAQECYEYKGLPSRPVYHELSGVEASHGPNGPGKRSRRLALVAVVLLGAASVYIFIKVAGLFELCGPVSSPATLRLNTQGKFHITVFEDLHFGESTHSCL